MKTKPSTCHSLEGPRLHTSQNQKCAPARSNKVRRSLPQKNYQNTQNNAPKRYAHTVGNRCDSAKCCVAAVYTYKYNINTILSRAIQQRYSQFEGLGKKGRITWPHGGTHLQNEAGAFHAPSVEPDPDPLQRYLAFQMDTIQRLLCITFMTSQSHLWRSCCIVMSRGPWLLRRCFKRGFGDHRKQPIYEFNWIVIFIEIQLITLQIEWLK